MSNMTVPAPRVSVVMSVYNDAERVENAVQSILAQSFRALELIVINDGSIDTSGAVLDRLAATDSRLRVIHQENTGLTRALIRGCREARGDYIARQDSDDLSHPLRIGEQVALLDSDARIGFVSCAAEYIGPGDEHLTFIYRPTDPETATHGLLEMRQGPPAHGSVMFRKSLYKLVGGYRAEFHYSQDSDLWLRMGEHALIGYLADVRYILLRELAGASGEDRPVQRQFGVLALQASRARRENSSEEQVLQDADKLAHDLISTKSSKATGAGDGRWAQSYLIGSQLVINGDARARSYLLQVLTVQPWHLRAWIRLLQSLLSSLRRALVGANQA